MNGSGLRCDGFLLSLKHGSFSAISGNMLQAVSDDGQKAFEAYMTEVSQTQVKDKIKRLFSEINSSTHLPESAYKNGIRLDTEYRCQNQKCNPAGNRRLLFVSAGSLVQAIQIKCTCGLLNTFWKNRIDFDEHGALKMESVR